MRPEAKRLGPPQTVRREYGPLWSCRLLRGDLWTVLVCTPEGERRTLCRTRQAAMEEFSRTVKRLKENGKWRE